MKNLIAAKLDSCLESLPTLFPGPGGAVAVLQAGQILARHAWGFANAELRIPFTPQSLFRMCSITKQFTCGVILGTFPDPTVLDDDIKSRLPRLEQPAPGALHLCHNQSGLRDYWAVAMLHGSPVEAPFGDREAAKLIAGTRTLHFAPGTHYSYVNQNFRLLSDIAQARTGKSFSDLLRIHLFDPAGMHTAFLAADTRAMPDGTQGYEGTQATGYRAAVNNVIWTGDAGLGASLDDMIAWERHIDATRDDPAALYTKLSAPVTFADGAVAPYGFGLSRNALFGRRATGHGGALRGWRSHRLHLSAERISIVVMFNHISDASAAAKLLAAAMLDEPPPPPAAPVADQDWLGTYIVPPTGLSARIIRQHDGKIRLTYAHPPELLDLTEAGIATDGQTVLRAGQGALWMDRPQENFSAKLAPVSGEPNLDVAGHYRCVELNAELTLINAGGVLYGAFSGFLGQGRMELLDPLATDLWTLPCPRALDHTPPGDWTLHISRDAAGLPVAVTVGCWLARNLRYERLSAPS
jgi:D-aminopeptidase